jgi:hypothetical protein
MVEMSRKRLPGTGYDIWLIETSRDTIKRSRELLEQTKTFVTAEDFGPSLSRSSAFQTDEAAATAHVPSSHDGT